jgi:hypothetical protein
MELKDKTIEELKVIAFDIDQSIKKSQHNYQVVINLINEKLQAQKNEPSES